MEHLGQFILNHWMLCAAFLLTVLAIYLQEFLMQKTRAQALSPHAVVHSINQENAIVIDLRSKEVFANGHITDAIQASIDDFDQPRFKKYKTRPVILVAGKELQMDSLIKTLRGKEYKQLMTLAGGIEAWQAAGLPLIKGNTKNTTFQTKNPELLRK
ncbi:MAG: rhodanese-like domain-containing protein [Legionella sp.]|nr:rhodanese-like domain-containing protein [Legionella sp.]